LRILIEEAPERLELVRQSLGVVETVDADDAAHRGSRLHQPGVSLDVGEVVYVDSHREAGNGHQAVKYADASVRHDAPEHAVLQIAHQIADIGQRL
jgi:hypothetical protein